MGLLHWQKTLEADYVAVLDLPVHRAGHYRQPICRAQRSEVVGFEDGSDDTSDVSGDWVVYGKDLVLEFFE